MNGVACGDCGDSSSGESIAESARKSLTLSLALAEQFAHADSSTDEEADETDDAFRMAPAGNGIRGASTAAGAQQRQHQHQHQHQQPEQQLHQCHSWDSSLQQHQQEAEQQQVARRVAPHERLMLENQRRKVCEEIVETERKYCSCLWTLIDLIGGSLRAAAFVSTRDLCLIFPNTLPRLYDLHAAFLARLEESACVQQSQRHHQAGGPQFPAGAQCSLAATVLQFLLSRETQLLQLYRGYVSQFSPAMRCVRRCRRQSRKFRDLLLGLQRHPDCEALDLTAFLLTPVQRLPRYLLLLRQLADRTEPRHPDQAYLTQATARLRCVLDQLNCSIQGALADATAAAATAAASAAAGAIDSDGPTPRRSRPSLPARLMRRPPAPPPDTDPDASVDDSSALSSAAAAHFLLGDRQRRRATQPELPWDSPRHLKRRPPQPANDDPARCRSVPPDPAGAVVVFQLSPETARRLRPADRSRSVGDIVARRRASVTGASVVPTPAPAATAAETGGAAAMAARRRKSSPKATVKETFRKMFLSRRKVSDSRLGNSWNDL